MYLDLTNLQPLRGATLLLLPCEWHGCPRSVSWCPHGWIGRGQEQTCENYTPQPSLIQYFNFKLSILRKYHQSLKVHQRFMIAKQKIPKIGWTFYPIKKTIPQTHRGDKANQFCLSHVAAATCLSKDVGGICCDLGPGGNIKGGYRYSHLTETSTGPVV